MATANSTRASSHKHSVAYEAFLLLGTMTKRDPSGMGYSDMRSIGRFSSRKAAEDAAQSSLQRSDDAVSCFVKEVLR